MGDDIMNAKKYILVLIVLNTVLAAFAACFCHMPWQTQGEANDARAIAMSGAEGKFGPTVEVVLSAGRSDGSAENLDLETGRRTPTPANGLIQVSRRRHNGLDSLEEPRYFVQCLVGGRDVRYL